MRQGIYNVRDTNWRKFDLVLQTEIHKNKNNTKKTSLTLITDAITTTCDKAMPKTIGTEKKVHWWSENLNKMRKSTGKQSERPQMPGKK
jgi:hypothetical protein